MGRQRIRRRGQVVPLSYAEMAQLRESMSEAVKKGYEYAIENPDAAAEILSKYAPDYDLKFLKESQKYLSSEYARDADSWGVMKDSVWDNYTAFMYENKLITEKIKADEQYTNEFVTK